MGLLLQVRSAQRMSLAFFRYLSLVLISHNGVSFGRALCATKTRPGFCEVSGKLPGELFNYITSFALSPADINAGLKFPAELATLGVGDIYLIPRMNIGRCIYKPRKMLYAFKSVADGRPTFPRWLVLHLPRLIHTWVTIGRQRPNAFRQ